MKQLLTIIAVVALCGCAAKTPSAPQQQSRHPTRRGLVGPEVVLASNYADPAATKSNLSATSTYWFAATFKPQVPPEATSYTITSATVYFGKTNTSGIKPWRVKVYNLDANGKMNTSGTAVDSVAVQPSEMQMVQTGQVPPAVTVAFTKATGLDPAKPISVVIAPDDFSPMGLVGVQTGGVQTPPDMGCFSGWSTAWLDRTPKDLLIEVKGTYTTP